MPALNADTLLAAYANGAYPMADPDGVVRFYESRQRGVIPLWPADAFHVPATLRQVIRQGRFEVRVNTAFGQTVAQGCMKSRRTTWINRELVAVYDALHAAGHAHSVEAWHDGRLAGGLFGITLGAAFLGESMFHVDANASKVALVYLVERLRERGFELLDTQLATPHLEQFGCVSIPRAEYLRRLGEARQKQRNFA